VKNNFLKKQKSHKSEKVTLQTKHFKSVIYDHSDFLLTYTTPSI
jgi:hypothetical protein